MRQARRNGFTIIEVMVVIAIMVILLVLSVINMSGQQKNARDNERKQDADNIARGLERYYNRYAKYPDTTTAATAAANSTLPDVETSSYYFSFNSTSAPSFTAVTTPASGLVTEATPSVATTSTIAYLPMTWMNSRWELCNTTSEDCSRFTLFYTPEQTGTAILIRSRSQQ